MKKNTAFGLLYLGVFLIVILLNSCGKSGENQIGYRVYVEDNNLIYFDDVTGKEIYRETFNWENPSGVQKAIINDNK